MIWDALIEDPGLVAGHHGDLEHVRELLGPGRMMRPNTIYWLSDKTPHQTIPVREDTYRQFFRVVTSSLSAWFPEHSTANRLGVKPDPSITKVIEGNKFDGELQAAPPCLDNPSAVQSRSDDEAEMWEEKRQANDGKWYTWAEFEEHYGSEQVRAKWDAAVPKNKTNYDLSWKLN